MASNNNYIFLLLIAFIFTANVFAQEDNPLDKKISINIYKKNLVEIIEKIKAESGIEFSYSKDIIKENIIRTIDAENKSIETILGRILNGTGLKYKVISQHIIIYKPKGYHTKKGEKLKIITVYDTIITMHHDTIITRKYDTIINRVYHHDTITFFDTINTQKEKPYKWFATVNTGIFRMPSYNQSQGLNNKTIDYSFTGNGNYTIGTDIGIEYKHLTFYSGMDFTVKNTKNTYNIKEYETDTVFDYAYTGGYWDKELVVRYYEWDGQDTTWVNVYDSTYIPVDSSIISTNIDTTVDKTNKAYNNKYSIIEIPFIVGYHTSIKKVNLSVKGGIIAGYIINAKGKKYHEDQFIDINTIMQHKFLFSFSGALGIGYDLNKKISLYTDVYYRKQFVPNYPKEMLFYRKPECFGFKIGLKYTFQRQ